MKNSLVYHHNLIGHEINESLEYYKEDVFDREIYCRKKHLILEPTKNDCMKCPYFAGLEQGHGHECAWEDVADAEHTIRHEDRYKEYERVDRLMKLGILKKVDYRLIENVKNMPYDKEKWIYKQSDDRTCRYILGTKGTKTLICCGVNPSTASPEDLDPTMKNVEAIARANGYDSYVMINLYPMRATDPKEMHKHGDESIIDENMKHIKELLSVGNCDIWAAWGTLIETRGYLKECLEKLLEITKSYNCNWYTIGKRSKDNHPHHPLYLNKDNKMVKFEDIEEYASMLKTRK